MYGPSTWTKLNVMRGSGASSGFAFGPTVDAGVACAWIRWLAVKAREKIRNWRNMRVGEAGMRVSSRCRFERNTGWFLAAEDRLLRATILVPDSRTIGSHPAVL